REISSILLEKYDNKEIDEIRIIYSDMESEFSTVVKMMRLLPFDRREFWTEQEERNEKDVHYEFYPNVNEVINRVIPGYVSGCIYGALVDSFSAEQNARMTAMDSANKNAEALLADLKVQYNRVRQAAITQEITEVAAGAKAQRKKRKAEE
ncbi:MAG: FoF1 ATP synthase subunit gamma, partial [Eubacterium sp.]|nr:FoF1 ATP synthase subunit gamma [Eubacterium sp.]